MVVFLLQLLYLWIETPGFFICTPASLDLVMRRKISTPLGNDILGAQVVAEPILCKGGSGGHVDRMAKYKIMIKKGLRIKPTYKIKTYTYMFMYTKVLMQIKINASGS